MFHMIAEFSPEIISLMQIIFFIEQRNRAESLSKCLPRHPGDNAGHQSHHELEQLDEGGLPL